MDSEEIYFNLNPVNFFIISGLLQNFILAGILFFKRGDRLLANRLLSVTILCVNLHLTYLMVLDTNLDNLFPYFLWFPYSYLAAVGPLVFFYVQALTNLEFDLSKTNIVHFIPVIIELILQAIQVVYSIRTDQLFYNTPFYFYITPLQYSWAAGSILYYLHLSLKIINSHEVWVLKNFSNLKEVTLAWLNKLIIHYRFLWIIWVPFAVAFLLFFRFQFQFLLVVLALYLLMLILTYLTFWIGLEGLRNGNLVYLEPMGSTTANKNFSKLKTGEINPYIEGIKQLMTKEKMYLNEHLALKDIATRLNADPNLVSFILNHHLGSNFYDFVNRYRIQEVVDKLNDPSFGHLTFLGIAVESGFNSKTTFNRVFKQVMGMTPSEFQKKKAR